MIILFTALITLIIVVIGLGYANIGLQIKRYPSYWHALAVKPTTSNTLIYVALGDSTAQGIGASSPARGYVGLIAKRIEAKTGRPVKVINVSVSGDKVDDVLQKQISQIQDIRADIVTIEIGANDVRTYNKQQFDAQFSLLLKHLPKGTYVSDMPRFDNPKAQAKATEISNTIGELVPKNGQKLVPLFAFTSKNTSPWRNSTDWFHPSNQAYMYWADAFWSQIENDPALQ